MNILIYPAHLFEADITHADDWNEQSTYVLTEKQLMHFAAQTETMDVIIPKEATKFIRTKTLRLIFRDTNNVSYLREFNRLCAIAEILKAPYIAFQKERSNVQSKGTIQA